MVGVHDGMGGLHRRPDHRRAGRGAAPDTIPAHDLATALNLMNERVVFASQDTRNPTLPEDAALEALAHVWVASIYGPSTPRT